MSTATMKLDSIFNDCKDMSRHELFALLNTFTINRAYKIVDKLCKKLIHSFDDYEAVIKISDSYFKMGKYYDGLRMLNAFLEKEQATSHEKTRIFFQQAKILCAIDLNTLAYKKVCGQLLTENEDFKTRAELALENFDFKLALADYKEYFIKLKNVPFEYELKKLQLNYLRSLTFCGELLKAKKLIQDWAIKWSEPELKGNLFFILGEIYLTEKKYEKSLLIFEKSKNLLIPDQDSLLNFEFISRQALLHGFMGNSEASAQFLRQATEILTRHENLIARVRLDVYKLQLGKLDKNDLFRLLFHPCIGENILEFFNLEYTHEIYHFGSFDEARIRIFLNSGEFDYVQSHSVDLSEEICLLAKLKIVGEWGLSIQEVKSIFFPHAIHSDEECMLRIEEMVAKLQKLYCLNVYKTNQRIYLDDDSRDIYVETGISEKPRFLSFVQIFELVDLCSYYNLSDIQADNLIKIWTEKEWIVIIGNEMSPKYVIK